MKDTNKLARFTTLAIQINITKKAKAIATCAAKLTTCDPEESLTCSRLVDTFEDYKSELRRRDHWRKTCSLNGWGVAIGGWDFAI